MQFEGLMRANVSLQRLRQGELVFGCASQTEIPQVFAKASFNRLFIDMEHRTLDFETQGIVLPCGWKAALPG
jgi:hypothetical protein